MTPGSYLLNENLANERCITGERLIHPRGGGVLPYKRLRGMCHWMGSHFHDLIDYNGAAFSIELLEWGHTFSVLGVRQLFIFTVSKRTRIFVLQVKSKCCSVNIGQIHK